MMDSMRLGWVRLVFGLLMVGLMLWGVVAVAQAAEVDNDGMVGAGDVITDTLMLSGTVVVMDGQVRGMLLVGGDSITINGKVDGTLFAAGRDIIITEKAQINGDVFVAGSSVEIYGTVNGNVSAGSASLVLGPKARVSGSLYSGGYGAEMQSGSTIDRDVFFGGYQVIFGGKVGRDTFAGAAAVEINGSIGRNASVEVAEPGKGAEPQMWAFMPSMVKLPKTIDPGLRIDKDASIGGKLTYTSPVEQNRTIQAQPEGGIVYQTPVPDQVKVEKATRPSVRVRVPFLDWFYRLARNFITLTVAGLLLIWLLPGLFTSVVEHARTKPLPAAGWGFVVIIVGYAGAVVAGGVLLAITILVAILSLGGLSGTVAGIGFSSLALVFAVFTLLVEIISKLLIAYLVGEVILKAISAEAKGFRYWAMLIGVTLYVVARAVPFLGWLVGVAVTLIGVGAMWLRFHHWWKRRAQTMPLGEPPAV